MMRGSLDIHNDQCPFADNVEVATIASTDAKGPTFARALASRMVRDAYENNELDTQDFCLQTDSHMDFVKNFDEKLVKDWTLADNEYVRLMAGVGPKRSEASEL